MTPRVIVPAAGVGTRLAAAGSDLPKCLFKVGGQTLAERALNIFGQQGITDFVFIVGHRAEAIKDTLGDQVNLVYNPFYRVSNGSLKVIARIISLGVTNRIECPWFAKSFLGDAFGGTCTQTAARASPPQKCFLPMRLGPLSRL